MVDFDNTTRMPMRLGGTRNRLVVISRTDLGTNTRGLALACLCRQYAKLKILVQSHAL